MSEIPAPRPESDEVLSQYPELARARELFIDLFRDRSPLVNLGYTNRQIEFTLPVLMLLQEEGVIEMDHLKNPYLSFDNPRDPNTQKLEVYYLPSRQGFNLFFVAKLDAPGFDSDYIAYRRLSPISESQGTLVPFGKKANISEQKVTKVLSVRKQQVSSGQLAWGRVGI